MDISDQLRGAAEGLDLTGEQEDAVDHKFYAPTHLPVEQVVASWPSTAVGGRVLLQIPQLLLNTLGRLHIRVPRASQFSSGGSALMATCVCVLDSLLASCESWQKKP